MKKTDNARISKKVPTNRIKWYFGTVISVLVFFSVIAILTSDTISNRLRSASYEHYQLLAGNTAEKINGWLLSKKEIIENQRASLETINDFSPEYLTLFLEKAVKNRNDNDDICDLYFVASDGVLSTANGYYTDYDLRTRGYYLSCLDTRDVQYTSTYRDISTGSYIMTISAGCLDQHGNFAGIIALDIYADAFLEAVNDAQVPLDSYLFLIDSDLGMASHPYDAYDFVDDMAQSVSELPGNIYADLIETIVKKEYSVTSVRDYDGVTRDMFVSSIDSCGWFVVAAISEKVMRSPEKIMISFMLAALFISLVLGIIWTLMGTRQMMLRLEKARNEADSANETKSVFLASMSHEIRTPINAVLGMNEMIMRQSQKAREKSTIDENENRKAWADVSEYSEYIKHAGDNLLSIINDILDFSKIEAGRMEIVNGEYKLGAVLNDVSNMIFFRTRGKGIDFILDVDETIPGTLYGDEVRIRQVLINLLNNAVKYTGKGGVKLSVRLQEGETPKEGAMITLVISVKDTGIGIKEEDMDRLFTKFERVDLEKNSAVEGTGLGLAITQNLLTLMDGRISVKSTYGEGSEFTVYLPQKIISEEPLGDFRNSFRESITRAKSYKESFYAPNVNILAVDDTRLNLTVIKGLLKSTEMKISTARSGEEAIKIAGMRKFDLILMDQRMPIMNGAEAMQRIRSDENSKNKDTVFIALTADAVNGARERYIEMGFRDYLTKPVDGVSLEKMLLKYLPGDKILTRKPDEDRTKTDELYDTQILEQAGIDVKAAMRYSGGDQELYRALLESYGQEAEEKKHKLLESYLSEDWNSYSILVHSVKSSSKTIGAAELSNIARGLEAAAKEADAETIRRDHKGMMDLYDRIATAVISASGEHPSPNEQDKQNDHDDGVLEFIPG